MKICYRCRKDLDDSQFYKRYDRDSLNSYCKKCFHSIQMLRWKERKVKAIEYLGGKCSDCGNNYPSEVYQFHHVDPSKKDFTWNKGRLKKWEDVIEEIDKCILLCANCHILRHSKSVEDYK